MLVLTPPDILRPNEEGRAYRPSWSGRDGFVNEQHAQIFDLTKDLPGWQDPADSHKLYEMAYHNGAVILEVGVYGGRSAVVEVLGALAGWKDRGGARPQWYGVDVDPQAFNRSFPVVEAAGLNEYALFYHGDLAAFRRDIPITPSMVFVDGDHRYPGVWADLNLLAGFLAAGTPVLCHDYIGIDGVHRAVNEWIAEGSYEAVGVFGCSMLLRCAGCLRGSVRGLDAETFQRTRQGLRTRYEAMLGAKSLRGMGTGVRDLTSEARRELVAPAARRAGSGRAPWPYANPDTGRLPATMPGGRPWPRISIVTPSFNQGRYIEETLLSVANQGYPNVEHIVMDGGSTDETLSVLARYAPARVVSEADEGQGDAINKGMKLATGDILTWLNSDDMLAPGALAAAALAFHTSGADMVAGVCQVYRDGHLILQHLTSCADGPLPLEDLLDVDHRWLEGQFFFQPEVMFTRALWEKAGGRVDPSLRYVMDYELWLRFAEQGAKIHAIGRPICWFRFHAEQKTAETEGGGFRAELPVARDAFLARTGRAPAKRPAKPVKPRLRVAFFNDIGYAYGAGIAHRRLVQAFAAAGHEVAALCAMDAMTDSDTGGLTSGDVVDALGEFGPDLVVVGNLHSAGLEPGVLARIAGAFPTVCVVHDQWLFTGRCAYPGGCRKYLTGCDESCTCPASHLSLPRERVAEAWASKRAVLASESRLRLWSNSRWAGDRAVETMKASPAPLDLARLTPATIRFGLDRDDFRPRDKAMCRELLGLPRDKFIIMTSASDPGDERKGLRHVADALTALGLPDAHVACVGRFTPPAKAPLPIMQEMGYITDPVQLAALYSAVDLFVGPSLEEAFGQVFVEAAACGTPSIGYAVGGVPEALIDGVTGRLVRERSAAALAEAIEELYLDAALRENMGRWGPIWAENEFSIASACHAVHAALHGQGLGGVIGLRHKIDLVLRPVRPPAPSIVSPGVASCRIVSGIDAWEGPLPEKNIGRFRWASGPLTVIQVRAKQAGRCALTLTLRNFWEGQRVRLTLGNRVLGEQAVPVTRHERDHIVRVEFDAAKGVNEVHVHSWKWDLSTPRLLSVLVVGVGAMMPDGASVADGERA